MMFYSIVRTDNAASTLLIRLMAGAIFLSEGIQKFLFADKLGSGRFMKIGLPNPYFLAPFVGSFEIACGVLILLGLLTRLAAIPLCIIILVAIATTKAQLLSENGFWSMLHDSQYRLGYVAGDNFPYHQGGWKMVTR
ncbi:MAG: DoxX family protein [Chitinophagaceae bacterium]